MKSLFIFILGIDYIKDDYIKNDFLMIPVNKYDILYLESKKSELLNEIDIQNKINNMIFKIEELNYNDRPSIVFLTHSFGCIFSLHIVKALKIEYKSKLIFFDPTNNYTRRYIEKISYSLVNFFDKTPKNIKSNILIIKNYTKGCNDINNCDSSYVINNKKRDNIILELFENSENIEIISLYLPKKIKYKPHELYKIHPDVILDKINNFL
jgi:hypothetical protein